jgi:hypothetical protein
MIKLLAYEKLKSDPIYYKKLKKNVLSCVIKFFFIYFFNKLGGIFLVLLWKGISIGLDGNFLLKEIN